MHKEIVLDASMQLYLERFVYTEGITQMLVVFD
jgi:hypothetical protein